MPDRNQPRAGHAPVSGQAAIRHGLDKGKAGGTLISLRGQATFGNRFPNWFGNDFPAHFPTDAPPLESPAVAGPLLISRRSRAGGSSGRRRVQCPGFFLFAFRGWFAWQSGARRKTFTPVARSGVTGQVRLPLRSSAARRTAIACPGDGPQAIAFHLAAAAAPGSCPWLCAKVSS